MVTTDRSRQPKQRHSKRSQPQTWKLEDAKARFSELVRLARSEGPQTVSVRGEDAVVVISVEELDRLKPLASDRTSLVSFLEGLHLENLDTTREPDAGRDVDL
jgi:antitoxin Phd